MARFRLRFLLQEFDLVGPEVILGRSPDCHITIEDPLISRHHAKIRVSDDAALLSDLGSRNGVRINGQPVAGEVGLAHGDRVRLGTQELVFLVVSKRDRSARPTGYMRMCRACGTAYPEGALACPHCGAAAVSDDDTISGLVVEPKHRWTFQLLGEVIDRAIATGKAVDADRVMRRAAAEVDERVAAGERIDPSEIASVATYALRLCKLLGSQEWLMWALAVHRQHDVTPSAAVVDYLESIDTKSIQGAHEMLAEFAEWWRARAQREARTDVAGLSRIERWVASRA